MCGRFSLEATWDELSQWYDILGPAANLEPRYNIAPTQMISVLRLEALGIMHTPLRWGLIPAWAKEPDKLPLLINARAETASDKPSFRAALKARRCLIPASGYYEWSGAEGQKTPHYITDQSGGLMIFAGLWERWSPLAKSDESSENIVESCTILTTKASADIANVHHRMPVILTREQGLHWLSEAGENLLDQLPQPKLANWPVSTKVNAVRNEGRELITPARTPVEDVQSPTKKQLDLFS